MFVPVVNRKTIRRCGSVEGAGTDGTGSKTVFGSEGPGRKSVFRHRPSHVGGLVAGHKPEDGVAIRKLVMMDVMLQNLSATLADSLGKIDAGVEALGGQVVEMRTEVGALMSKDGIMHAALAMYDTGRLDRAAASSLSGAGSVAEATRGAPALGEGLPARGSKQPWPTAEQAEQTCLGRSEAEVVGIQQLEADPGFPAMLDHMDEETEVVSLGLSLDPEAPRIGRQASEVFFVSPRWDEHGASSPPASPRGPRPSISIDVVPAMSTVSKASRPVVFGSVVTEDLWTPEDAGRASADHGPTSTAASGKIQKRKLLSNVTSMEELEAKAAHIDSWKSRLWASFTDRESESWVGVLYFRSMPYIILASVITALCEPQPEVHVANVALDVFFIFELAVRFYVSPNKKAFIVGATTVLDAIALLPLVRLLRFCSAVDGVGWPAACFWQYCFMPFVRGCKYLRFFDELLLLEEAAKKAAGSLPLCIYIFVLMVLWFAPLLYIIEPRDSIASMPDAMWFCVVSMSTVGYGDIAPRTPAGRLTTTVLLFSTVIYTAIPLGIVGTCFAEVWSERDFFMLRHQARTRFQQWGFTAGDVASAFKLFAPARASGDDDDDEDDEDEGEDEDVELDLPSFKRMMHAMKLGLPDARITQLFGLLDLDGSGFCSQMEFVQKVFPKHFYYIMYSERDSRSNSEKS